jgi:lipase chaperone LimK
MKAKTIVWMMTIVILAASFLVICYRRPAGSCVVSENKDRPHIIAARYASVLKKSELDYKKEDFSPEKVAQYFTDDLIHAHTYNYLQYIDNFFPDADQTGDQVESIRSYLSSLLPPEQAAKMFQLYGLYQDYQLKLHDKIKARGLPASPQEALDNLADLQEYRRAVFGDETADILFGASVEAQEFAIRRNAILYDAHLYATEKEKRLKALAKEMWGDELDPGDGSSSYARYQEQLRLYQKDLAEMRTDGERQDFLQHLMMETFDPVQQMRLEEAERALVEEKQTKAAYDAREQEILNAPDLSDEARAQKIHELQETIFGEQAEAFRRREAMRADLGQP